MACFDSFQIKVLHNLHLCLVNMKCIENIVISRPNRVSIPITFRGIMSKEPYTSIRQTDLFTGSMVFYTVFVEPPKLYNFKFSLTLK